MIQKKLSILAYTRFYLGIKFLGGSLSITVNDCAQDMHIDLMHALYVYSRVMRGGGGGGGYL